MGLFSKKKKKEEEVGQVTVDLDKMDFKNEAYFRIQVRKEGENTIFSFDSAGNWEMLLKVIIQQMEEDAEMNMVFNVLADNIMVRRIAKMSGKTPEEVMSATKDKEEMDKLKQYMAKGGEA